ncbi:hypothetical protein N7470_001942 [Penicillium chermesinum]|nr:hypothetical protein N7470_001942 [Penicillium chermesinum]
MVFLVTTPRILAAWTAVPAERRQELDLPAALDLHGPIAHAQLLRLSKYLENDSAYTSSIAGNEPPDPTVLSSLLRGTKVYVPPPPKKPEPSQEYLASKARLTAIADQQAYNRLLNPTYTPNADYADPHALRDTHGQPVFTEDTLTPSLVFNIFLSVLITGFSVYWALSTFHMPGILARTFSSWTGPRAEGKERQGASDAVRVLLSIFAALAVAVAESFLYAAYLGKLERARIAERKLKERKVLVGAFEGEGSEEREDLVTVGEKEEIWGKGLNGGVRRRLREKYEKGKKDLT